MLKPQAPLIWQRIAFDDASDTFGPVGLGTTSGPVGRVGLRGRWNFRGDNGMLWQPYACANYWRGYDAEATTSFCIGQVKLLQDLQTVEAFVGFTGKLSNSFNVYAQTSYQFDVGGTTNVDAKGTAGIRFSW